MVKFIFAGNGLHWTRPQSPSRMDHAHFSHASAGVGQAETNTEQLQSKTASETASRKQKDNGLTEKEGNRYSASPKKLTQRQTSNLT